MHSHNGDFRFLALPAARFPFLRKTPAGDDSVILFGNATHGPRWVSFSGDENLASLTLSIRPPNINPPTGPAAGFNSITTTPASDESYHFWCLPTHELVVRDPPNPERRLGSGFINKCEWADAWETPMSSVECVGK